MITTVPLVSRMVGAERVTNLILLRHGETAFNVGGVVDGRSSSTLTALGKQQAAAAGAYLRAARFIGPRPWRLISSPFPRATETAANAFPGTHVELDAGFQEVDVGHMQGRDWKTAVQRMVIKDDHHFETPFPSGESYREGQLRAIAAVGKYLRSEPMDNVIVSHGGIIVLMLLQLLNLPASVFPFAEIDNGSCTVVECHDFDGLLVTKLKLLNHVPLMCGSSV